MTKNLGNFHRTRTKAGDRREGTRVHQVPLAAASQIDSSGIFHHGATKMFEGLKAGVGSKSNGDDRHQAWNEDGDKTKGIGNDLGDCQQAGMYKAGGAKQDGVNETRTKAGNKSKGESKGTHKAETKGNGGDLHQAKMGTGDNTEAKIKTETEGGKNLQVETRTGGKGRGRR